MAEMTKTDFNKLLKEINYVISQEFVGTKITQATIPSLRAKLINYFPNINPEKLIVMQSDIDAGRIYIDYRDEVMASPEFESKLREYREREDYIKHINDSLLFLPQDAPKRTMGLR